MPKLPEQSAELSRGLIIDKSNVTWAQAATLGEGVSRRLRIMEEVLGEPLDQILGQFTPAMRAYLEQELAVFAVAPVVAGHYQVFAGRQDLFQFAAAEAAGKVIFEEAVGTVRTYVKGLQEEQDRIEGDVVVVRPTRRHLAYSESNAELSTRRFVGLLQHDCELDIAFQISPIETWMAGRRENIREARQLSRAEEFRGVSLELVELGLGLPLHSPGMAPFGRRVSEALKKIHIQDSENIFISSTRRDVSSSALHPDDLLNPTAVVQWERTDKMLNNLGVRERIDLTIDQARQLAAPYVTRKNAGIMGVIGLGLGAAISGIMWNRNRHR